MFPLIYPHILLNVNISGNIFAYICEHIGGYVCDHKYVWQYMWLLIHASHRKSCRAYFLPWVWVKGPNQTQGKNIGPTTFL